MATHMPESANAASGEAAAERLLEGADPATLGADLLEAIEALWRKRSTSAADALARINAPKDAAKAARRALFKLQSAGIRPALPEEAPTDAEAAPAPAKARLLQADISSYDPRGTRAIMVLLEKPFAGLLSLFVIASDTEGLMDADLGPTTKKAYAARIRNFAGQYETIRFTSAPPEYAVHLIHKMAALNDQHEHHHPLPQDYSMLKTVAPDIPEWEGPPPIYSELDAEQVRGRVDLMATGELAESEFAGWRFDEEQLKEWLVRLQTARGGPLVVSAEAQKERERTILDEATDALFTAADRARAKERLEETAYFLLHDGQQEAADRCLRAALNVEESAAHDSPFLRQLVASSVQQVTNGEVGGEEASAESGPPRTESGIILPA